MTPQQQMPLLTRAAQSRAWGEVIVTAGTAGDARTLGVDDGPQPIRAAASIAKAKPSPDDPPMNAVPREELDAKIAASEARTDAKFARIEGLLDRVSTTLTHIDTRLTEGRAESRADIAALHGEIRESRRHASNVAIGLVATVTAIIFGIVGVYQTGLTGRQVIGERPAQAANVQTTSATQSATPTSASAPTPAPATQPASADPAKH